jgi:hypothetical protein
MEHKQNSKKLFQLKTRLGKNYTTGKFNSEGRPNICGTQARTGPECSLYCITLFVWLWLVIVRIKLIIFPDTLAVPM